MTNRVRRRALQLKFCNASHSSCCSSRLRQCFRMPGFHVLFGRHRLIFAASCPAAASSHSGAFAQVNITHQCKRQLLLGIAFSSNIFILHLHSFCCCRRLLAAQVHSTAECSAASRPQHLPWNRIQRAWYFCSSSTLCTLRACSSCSAGRLFSLHWAAQASAP